MPSEEVRDQAIPLLRVHALRAVDALQLAAARIWAGPTARAELVTYDERLALAARLDLACPSARDPPGVGLRGRRGRAGHMLMV